MMRSAPLLVCLALVTPAVDAAGPPVRPAAIVAEMEREYALDEHFGWETALRHLKGDDSRQRRRAADYLVALLTEARKRARLELEPWEQIPPYHTKLDSEAHELRDTLARVLAEVELPPEGTPVLRWFLDDEPDPLIQGEFAPALARLPVAHNGLLASLIDPPHPNAAVVVTALEQLRERKLPVAAAVLLPLCQHHRASIRKAARQLYQALGRPAPPPFDPVQALRSPAMQRRLAAVRAMLVDPPPVKAKLARFAFRFPGDKVEDDNDFDPRGWLLRETSEQVELLDCYGARRTSTKERPQPGLKADEQFNSAVVLVSPEAEVKRLEQVRDEWVELNDTRRDSKHKYFGHGATAESVVTAWWLEQAGHPALAARLLLGAMDTIHRDEDLVPLVRHDLGGHVGCNMLTAFVSDRDYGKAESLARHLDRQFADTRYHGYAHRLLDELPRRKEDFRTLKLPTAMEWTKASQGLTRPERIKYLCVRLRLLNCFQDSSPGWPDPRAEQYAEPARSGSFVGRFGLGGWKTEVINPLVELTGKKHSGIRVASVGLRVEDIPQLATHLRDDWAILAVGYGRINYPSNVLLTIRPIVAELINDFAGQDVCQLGRWKSLSAKEREREVTRIINWANSRRGK